MVKVKLFKNTSKKLNESNSSEIANQIATLQNKMLAIDKRINQQIQNIQKSAMQQKQQIQQQIIQLQAKLSGQTGVTDAGNNQISANNNTNQAQNPNTGVNANTNQKVN